MAAAPEPSYFTDENALGLGSCCAAREGRTVFYPGHDELPEVPLGTDDLDWMEVVGERGLVVVTRDRRIRSRRPSCVPTGSSASGLCGSGRSGTWDRGDQLALFLKHEARLEREIVKKGDGPWALAMSEAGLRPLQLREP